MGQWPPYQPRHYTSLALIHHKDKCTDTAIISTAEKLAGKRSLSSSKMPKVHSSKNVSDIFVSVTADDGYTINPCIILIEGAPGMGKTVLAEEIAFQWASHKLLTTKKFLFLVLLRQCNFDKIVTIENFVQFVVKSSEKTPCLTKYLQHTEGKDLAIVFDGYDEISEKDRKNSIFADIVNRVIFSKCCLVITSRPTASSTLHGIANCRVEINGFTEEDRLDYIQTALEGSNDKVKKLTFYLQHNPTINALCYNPLNITILLCLVEYGIDKLPKTQTEMHKRFIEMTILRFFQKIDITLTTGIAKLPCPHNKVFDELAQLAYKALEIDKIVFTLHEIEETCPNLSMNSSSWNGLGLLKAVKYFDVETGYDIVTFHFLHFSIQEYMAAWYISTLLKNEQIKLLENTFWKHRYYNTWLMYVGITCGNSFALRHFLSGNWFQFITKIFKTSSITNKYLKNKIKCLHLFQCLVESRNEDMIASVSKFFENDKIDLSNQTLLPGDVNTLGFFLIRSIKQWKILDLSGCNIGSIGINILCDMFLDENSRHMIAIKKVDFSFNQLNFSSLPQLFKLLKSWHASEIIITDHSRIFQSYTVGELYRIIEDAFVLGDTDIKTSLQFGSFLFAHGIDMSSMFSNVVSFKSMYLLNCDWKSRGQEQFIGNFNDIHVIGTSFSTDLMKTLLSSSMATSIVVYNPILSYRPRANDKISQIFNKMTDGVKLIISCRKIQGIINTTTLSNLLSRLEILNLVVMLRKLHSNITQACSWRQDLCCDGSESDLIVDAFIAILHKITSSTCDLRIALNETNTVIAYNVSSSCIVEKIVHVRQPLRTIYISKCDIRNIEYEAFFVNTLTTLYVYNSHFDKDCLMLLFTKLTCKEIFIHSSSNININDLAIPMSSCENCSTLLVVKHTILGYKPTTKQIVLALQLEPSIIALKLLNYKGTFDSFNQIITMLSTTFNNWTELDFSHCSIGEIECESLYKLLKAKRRSSTVNVLKIHSEKLTTSILPKLIEIVFIWKAIELVFCGIEQVFYFDTKSRNKSTTTLKNMLLSVVRTSEKGCFFCNFKWNKIYKTRIFRTKLEITSFYFIKCQLSSIKFTKFKDYIESNHISQIHINNSTLHEQNILDILISCVNRRLELSICHTTMPIISEYIYNFITNKELFYQSKMSFVAVMENFTCGYNITEGQLYLLQSQKLCDLEHTIVSLISDTKQMHERELFVFQEKQLTALHFVGRKYQIGFIPKLVAVLKSTSSLELTITLSPVKIT